MQPQEPDWITTAQAAALLGISSPGVHPLAQRHHLARRQQRPHSPIFYRRDEIETLANTPERLTQTHNRALYRFLQPLGDPPADGEWRTTNQVAAFLDISPRTVRWLVTVGKLHTRQKEPGKRGSRHFFLKNEVEKLRKDAHWRKWHIAHRKGGAHLGQGRDIGFDPGPYRTIPLWLTTFEARYLLGISATTLYTLAKSGKIRVDRWPNGRKNRYWGADLLALLTDPTYRKRRQAWEKSKATRQANLEKRAAQQHNNPPGKATGQPDIPPC